MKLKGIVSIIIGGTGGIGKAICKAFLNEGAKVIVAARNNTELKKLASELSAISKNIRYLKIDISNEKEMTRLTTFTIDSFGKIDALINVSGTQAPIKPFCETEIREFENSIKTNFFGTVYSNKSVIAEMIKNS